LIPNEQKGRVVEKDFPANLMATRQHTIAVIDDDSSVLKAVGRLLTVAGYRAELYGCAEHVRERLATSPAICILMDCQLGQTSGIEFARELAATGFATPVIFMTGDENQSDRRLALDLGSAEFLQKPFLAGQLLESIAKATGTAHIE